MSHESLTNLTHATQPVSSTRGRRRLFTNLLQALVVLLAAHAFGATALLAQLEPVPDYAWVLQSGLFTSERDETVRVLITDVTESTDGIEVTVRFFDGHSELLSESSGEILPGQPLVAEFHNDQEKRILLRLEIELLSDDTKVVPITTLEVDRPGALAAFGKFSCAGPLIPQRAEFNCPELTPTNLSP